MMLLVLVCYVLAGPSDRYCYDSCDDFCWWYLRDFKHHCTDCPANSGLDSMYDTCYSLPPLTRSPPECKDGCKRCQHRNVDTVCEECEVGWYLRKQGNGVAKCERSPRSPTHHQSARPDAPAVRRSPGATVASRGSISTETHVSVCCARSAHAQSVLLGVRRVGPMTFASSASRGTRWSARPVSSAASSPTNRPVRTGCSPTR